MSRPVLDYTVIRDQALQLTGAERRALARVLHDRDVEAAREKAVHRGRVDPRARTLIAGEEAPGSIASLLEKRKTIARAIGGGIGDLAENTAALDRALCDLASVQGAG